MFMSDPQSSTQHPWTLPEHPFASRKVTKRKQNVFIRSILVFLAGAVFLPILYVYQILEIKHVPTSSTVHKNLQQFQEGVLKSGARLTTISTKHIKDTPDTKRSPKDLVLTAFLESPNSLDHHATPLRIRKTTATELKQVTFPNVRNCSTLMQDFPIDNYPHQDPFLPWIHDMIPTVDGASIQFVAQNRRRCHTGDGEIDTMKFWEPQISLLQGVPVVVSQTQPQHEGAGTSRSTATMTTYRLASSFQEATHNATRFQCRFHHGDTVITTLSVFPFDYEYVTWRKGKRALFQPIGKETELFWTSQLLFSCPVPVEFQMLLSPQDHQTSGIGNDVPAMYVDLIPIRTPARQQYLLTPEQMGPSYSSQKTFDLQEAFGERHILPLMDDAGRWQNLPVCRRNDSSIQSQKKDQQKPYRLVACTWTSSSYTRRGDAVRVSDSAQRLREWITFHLMVGVDHVYIYDNSVTSVGETSELRTVAESFHAEQLTYHVWPCKICNNNRPSHKNPGERSSQYAAEASCRTRYGERTEWMTFLDTDEYMVRIPPPKWLWTQCFIHHRQVSFCNTSRCTMFPHEGAHEG
jgi:Glycosyltransferase family 92